MLRYRELATDLTQLEQGVSEACLGKQGGYDGLSADYITFFDLYLAGLGQIIELVMVCFQFLLGFFLITRAHFCRNEALIEVLDVFDFASGLSQERLTLEICCQ